MSTGGSTLTLTPSALLTETETISSLLAQISQTIADLRAQPARQGDNQAPERNAAIDNLEVYVRLGEASVRVVREDFQRLKANTPVAEQTVASFRAVHVGVSWIMKGLCVGVGKVIAEHYHTQIDTLLFQLQHQGELLVHRLADAIPMLEQWAHLIK